MITINTLALKELIKTLKVQRIELIKIINKKTNNAIMKNAQEEAKIHLQKINNILDGLQ